MKRNNLIGLTTAAVAVAALAVGAVVNANDVALNGSYQTLTLSQIGSELDPVIVNGNGATVQCLKITGQYLEVNNVTVTGCSSHGVLITGKHVTFQDSRVFGNVTENGSTKCSGSGSWGSGVKVQVGGEDVTIRNNTVYKNCGEGIAATRGIGVVIEGNTVYDNFSVNIYIDNSPNSAARGNLIYNTTDSRYYRNNAPAVCVLLGTENYAGWGNQLTNVTVEGNTIKDCPKGIRFYGEVGGIISGANVVIRDNTFTNVPSPQVNVPGAIVSGTPAGVTRTPTATRNTPIPTNTPIPRTATATATPSVIRTPTATPQVTPSPVCVEDETIRICYWLK